VAMLWYWAAGAVVGGTTGVKVAGLSGLKAAGPWALNEVVLKTSQQFARDT
jgi:hypothetical protein